MPLAPASCTSTSTRERCRSSGAAGRRAESAERAGARVRQNRCVSTWRPTMVRPRRQSPTPFAPQARRSAEGHPHEVRCRNWRQLKREGEFMRRLLVQSVGACLLTLLVAANVSAQASISGLVQDATGAVLPGVTVEASSDALIEKV